MKAVPLFEEAAARTLDLCQIPLLNAMANRVLVNWLARQLRLPGNDVQGWVSTHPLLGAVRFGLKLPRATRSIYIGALDAGRSGIRSYIWIKDPCGICEVWLGISGRQRTRWHGAKLQEHLAPSGHMNVFLLSWTRLAAIFTSPLTISPRCKLC